MANRDWSSRAPRTQGVEHVSMPVVILPQAGNTVGAARVTAGGSNYTAAPFITFTGGGSLGAGAQATATLSGATIGAITIVNGGSGYTSAPTVVLNIGGGSGAAGTATVSGGVVNTLTLTAAGSGYNSTPTVTFTGGSGSGATASAAIFFSVGGFTISNAGSGYTTVPTVTISGGGGAGATAAATISAGVVNTITVTAAGSGFLTAPTVSISGGGGFGATATASIFGSVASLAITGGGSGYATNTTAPTVNFAAGSGFAGAATAVLNPKLGEGDPNGSYFSVALVQGGGTQQSGALNLSTLDSFPALVHVNSEPTTGWKSKLGPPSQGGSNTWTIPIYTAGDTTGVTSASVTAAGSGYTSPPTITLNAANGIVGFAATAVLSGGTVNSITITNPGFGATTTPTITLSGGGGSGATATLTLFASGAAADMPAGQKIYVLAVFRNSSVTP